jgi:hypothetical protein
MIMPVRTRWFIGAHRGASECMRQISSATPFPPPWRVVVVDPVPGRAASFLQQWSPSGARGGEAIEAHATGILDRVGPDDEVIVAVDSLQAMREAITRGDHAARVSAQIVGRCPGLRGAYFGLAITIQRGDTSAREQADLLLAALETVSADRTSSRVFTESGDALAPALLTPLRERVAALTAASATNDEPHHALTFVLANGDFSMAVVPALTGDSLAAKEEVAIRLTGSWADTPRMAVAFANVAEHTVDILLLHRSARGMPAVIGVHSFAAPAPAAPRAILTD